MDQKTHFVFDEIVGCVHSDMQNINAGGKYNYIVKECVILLADFVSIVCYSVTTCSSCC